MAIKLYQYDTALYKSAGDFNYPNKMQAGLLSHWWQDGFVSMDVALAGLLNSLNSNALAVSNEAGVAAVKLASNNFYNTEINLRIRSTYSVNDEFKAHRTNDTTTLTAIGACVTAVYAERDVLLDIS